MAKVSIIIPTHNRPRLLPCAVASAQAAGTDVEVIVVDDASRDETAAVCAKLSGIKYIRLERNQGVAGARNVGIVASSSPYIAFLDDDDLRLSGTLDLQLEALAANPDSGFVCGAMLVADQDLHSTGEVIAPEHPGGDAFWELLELDFPVMPISVLIRKTCFLRIGLLNSQLQGIDDWDLMVRIAELYPAVVMNDPVSIYRKPTPFSAQGSSRQYLQLTRAARHQLQLFKLPRVIAAPRTRQKEARRRTLNRISDVLLRQAVRELPKGAYGFACANFLTAVRLNGLRAARPAVFKKGLRELVAPGDGTTIRRAPA